MRKLSKGKVVIDIDGVLANFEGAFCEKFGWENRELVGLELRYPEHVEEIETFTWNPSTYEYLDILDIGVRIARFCYTALFDIYIVSSRPQEVEAISGRWLKQNKIPFHFMSVDSESKMARIRRINPVFIVDDLYSVCKDASDAGIPSFLIDHPWNQENEGKYGIIYRVKKFSDFVEKYQNYFD